MWPAEQLCYFNYNIIRNKNSTECPGSLISKGKSEREQKKARKSNKKWLKKTIIKLYKVYTINNLTALKKNKIISESSHLNGNSKFILLNININIYIQFIYNVNII